MIYLEYERYKAKYLEAQRWLNDVLTEQERLFTKTLPNAIRYDKVNVQVSVGTNNIEEYIIAMQEKGIDKRLEECKKILDDRSKLLKMKEEELRKSPDTIDKLYYFKFVDGLSPNQIAKTLNYSKAQVYRMLNQIKSEILKDETK